MDKIVRRMPRVHVTIVMNTVQIGPIAHHLKQLTFCIISVNDFKSDVMDKIQTKYSKPMDLGCTESINNF